MTKAAREHGASRVLGLVPAVWTRFADRLGLDIEPAGRVMELDGIDNQCVSIDLTRKLH